MRAHELAARLEGLAEYLRGASNSPPSSSKQLFLDVGTELQTLLQELERNPWK